MRRFWCLQVWMIRRLQLAVIIIAHGIAVRAGVVNRQIIPHLHLGQHPVNRKFVIVLAEGARHIIFAVTGRVLLSQHGNMVVRLRDETGAHIRFINLSGGIGIPYKPEDVCRNAPLPSPSVCGSPQTSALW